MKNIYYYEDFDSDVVTSKNQDFKLKKNYKWVHHNIFYKISSYLLYYIFLFISFIYVKLILHVKIVNKKVLSGKKNYFLFINHTQEVGDAFIPALITLPKRPYFIVNKANLGIPFLGKLLPMLGAIVVPEDLHNFKYFKEAINNYEKNHPIVVYPEGHVWPYYTKIRSFKKGGFQLAIDENSEIYSATVTYQKRKYSKKPRIVIYIEGGYQVNNLLTKKEKVNDIINKVRNSMIINSGKSNVEYVTYKKKDN